MEEELLPHQVQGGRWGRWERGELSLPLLPTLPLHPRVISVSLSKTQLPGDCWCEAWSKSPGSTRRHSLVGAAPWASLFTCWVGSGALQAGLWSVHRRLRMQEAVPCLAYNRCSEMGKSNNSGATTDLGDHLACPLLNRPEGTGEPGPRSPSPVPTLSGLLGRLSSGWLLFFFLSLVLVLLQPLGAQGSVVSPCSSSACPRLLNLVAASSLEPLGLAVPLPLSRDLGFSLPRLTYTRPKPSPFPRNLAS